MDSDDTMNPHEHKRRDWDMASKPGYELSGKTSDRIRSGDIPANALPKGRVVGEQPPSTDAIINARGQGLGRGATTERNGGN